MKSRLRVWTLGLVLGALPFIVVPDVARAETSYVAPEDMERTKAAVAEGKAGLALVKANQLDVGLAKVDHALDTLEFTLGPDDKLVQAYRSVLTNIYGDQGKTGEVQRVNARADQARVARQNQAAAPSGAPSGPASKQAESEMLLVQAMTAFQQQDFIEAQRLFEQALPGLEPMMQRSVSIRVQINSILAAIYDYSLNYDKAEALLDSTIRAVESSDGTESPLLEIPIERMANHFFVRGQLARALPYAQRYVALLRRSKPGTVELSDALRLLGDIQSELGDGQAMSEAVDSYAQAMALLPNTPEHTSRKIAIFASLGAIMELLGQEPRRLAVLQEGCALGAVSDEARRSAEPLCIAAARLSGRFDEADRLLSGRVAELEAKFGKGRSQFWAVAVHDLALVRHVRGKWDEALPLMREALEFEEERMRRELVTGSDEQKRTTFGAYQTTLYDVLSIGGAAPGKSAMNRLGFETLLRRKGRALDAEADAMQAGRLVGDSEGQTLLNRQREVRSLLTGLYLKGQSAPEAAVEFDASVKKLEEENDGITRRLSEKSTAYRRTAEPVTVQAVQAKLPADTALVEFGAYLPRDPRTGHPVAMKYVAFLLTSSGEVEAIDLGDAVPILNGVDALREKIVKRQPLEKDAKSLHSILLRDVRKKLPSSVRRLVLAPDDVLNLVPFAALMDEKGKYLVQDFEVDYVSSGRDLLRLEATRPAQSGPLVMGAPNFDAAIAGQDASARRSGDLGQVRFPPLPGTQTEVEKVAATLEGARLLTGDQATKQALESSDAPSVLHVATHGFFLSIDKSSVAGTRGFDITPDAPPPPPGARTENPLIRSGLALAGANAPGNAAGILAALEAATLRLDGTRLVVLSACETAVGQTDLGEGVYGLRRAFVVAGAESQLMSLWKVDDLATRDLMIQVYEALQSGKGRGHAVRDAQLALLSNPKYAHPYFWAAFIPSGNYGPMNFDVRPGVGEPSTGATGSEDDDDDDDPEILTADGYRVFLFGGFASIGNLLNQPNREAPMLGFTAELALFSGDRQGYKTGLAYHDALVLEAQVGLLTSTAHSYADFSEENMFGAGYLAAYEAAVGYRGHHWGLLGGLRPAYRGLSLGDVTHSGFVLPAYGVLELRGDDFLFALSGWYGALITDQETFGGHIDLTFEESAFVRFGLEQNKLSTAVGGVDAEDRVQVGRQVSTTWIVGIGASL